MFWVQAKETQHFDECWSEYVEKDTIRFWLRQLSPVFLLLLETNSGNCYWLSVEECRNDWTSKLADTNKSIEVTITRKCLLKRNGANTEFIKRVKDDTVLANANYGIPHMIGDGYVRSIPLLWLSKQAELNVRYRVRLGLDYLIGDCILKGNLQGAYEFGRLLTEFDRGHYDHFLLLARVCDQLGRYAEARDNYNIAIGICKDDPNWNKLKKPEDPTIEEVIYRIEKELATLKAKRAQSSSKK
ncbi:MAG: DUF4365 domain-containing protein [Candidatus Bathyarchaeota archaeon]|nr:DUF4365 domain-containing protein [Candidatus Bathyarchaeota archaeon]